MKIALITTQSTLNYGAILQAFASKIILEKYGHVVTIEYSNNFLKNHIRLIRLYRGIRGVLAIFHDILRVKKRYSLIMKVREFLNTRMNLTSEFTKDQLNDGVASGYDVYVCGSDQIWNPEVIVETTSWILFFSFHSQT